MALHLKTFFTVTSEAMVEMSSEMPSISIDANLNSAQGQPDSLTFSARLLRSTLTLQDLYIYFSLFQERFC